MAHERFESVRTDPPAGAPPYFFEESTAVVEPPPSAEATYVMVQSTGPVDPNDCEEPGAEALEVTVLWGTNVLEVFHLSPPRPFVVGSEVGAGVDFLLPPELAGVGRTAIVDVSGGVPRLVAPHGASITARGAVAPLDGVLSTGKVLDLELGALTFRVAAVTAGKRLPRAFGVDARGIGTSFLCSVGAVAAFLGVIAYYTPALGASLDGDLDRDQLARLRPYLTALAEREEKRKEEQGPSASQASGGGTPGTAAQGPSGVMGRPDRPAAPKRTAIRGSGEVVLSRHEAMVEASTFGMVGMLATMNARALPTAIWGADAPNGPDASDAWGALYAEEIGESGGVGGLGLIGPGEGGGGRGRGIGMGDIGTCGTNCGYGPGDKGGFGRSGGLGGGAHRPKGPVLRAAGETVLGGHLAPELIQRVVRQNFGRFRNCYEAGLRANPNLTGRVTARFIIDREGSVSSASNGGSDLPDSKVVSCVVAAFYGVSFPAPKDGVVRVSYPIMFTPG